MGFRIKTIGSFDNSKHLFDSILRRDYDNILRTIGDKGVDCLRRNTPVRSGKTAESWYYTIEKNANRVKIIWCNDNINKGVNIAIIMQYGHANGWGGYVKGVDYINPALNPVFLELKEQTKEVLINYGKH